MCVCVMCGVEVSVRESMKGLWDVCTYLLSARHHGRNFTCTGHFILMEACGVGAITLILHIRKQAQRA